MDRCALLRPGVLDGVRMLVAPRTPLAGACAAAGAEVAELACDLLDEGATLAADPRCDLLLVDAAGLFGSGGEQALRDALDGAWSALRAAATGSFIPAGAGRAVLAAPRPGAGPHAEALRAGLENLARTTSIEWARHGITLTALLPGPQTSDAELGDLVAYLASRAGAYFSGTALSLT